VAYSTAKRKKERMKEKARGKKKEKHLQSYQI
jgi:hypothetical protein